MDGCSDSYFVLAPPIGVDRAIETDIGTGVSRNDRPGPVGQNLGAQLRRRGVLRGPAVVESLKFAALKPATGVGARPAAADLLGEGDHPYNLSPAREHNKNTLDRIVKPAPLAP